MTYKVYFADGSSREVEASNERDAKLIAEAQAALDSGPISPTAKAGNRRHWLQRQRATRVEEISRGQRQTSPS